MWGDEWKHCEIYTKIAQILTRHTGMGWDECVIGRSPDTIAIREENAQVRFGTLLHIISQERGTAEQCPTSPKVIATAAIFQHRLGPELVGMMAGGKRTEAGRAPPRRSSHEDRQLERAFVQRNLCVCAGHKARVQTLSGRPRG